MTPTPQPKALELAAALDVFLDDGYISDGECRAAAAELRRQHAEIEALRIDSIACREAIEHALQLVEDFAASPEGDGDMSQGSARATRRRLNEAIGKMSPRLMYERDGPKPMYSLHYKELRAERDSLRSAVESEREARKAAQIRQAELTDEVVRLEPMRQRAADIERLTAEVERLKQSNAGFEARAVFAEDYAASLRLLVDRLRADAERYQCLRQQHEEADSGITMCVFYPINDSSLEPIGCMPGELDAAIAARDEQWRQRLEPVKQGRHGTVMVDGAVVCCNENDREPCPQQPERRCASCPGNVILYLLKDTP